MQRNKPFPGITRKTHRLSPSVGANGANSPRELQMTRCSLGALRTVPREILKSEKEKQLASAIIYYQQTFKDGNT